MIDVNLEKLKNKKVLLAVSGGVDSMVLLDLVCKGKDKLNVDVGVCHFEHGIRGRESELDMELVQKKCVEYGVTVYVRRENIPAICGKGNVEETARERRYAFFYECLKEQEADFLVLAHHKGDNCETVLMNIIRGCGTGGLCGMEEMNGAIVRPLLQVSKEELYAYAREQGIEFREDSTNSDVSYFRNSVRHELMPLLKKKNPKIEDAIERLREIASVENSFFEDYICSLDWIKETFYGYDIEVEKYICSHEAVKRRAVMYVLKRLTGKDYDYQIYKYVNGLSRKETGKKVCTVQGAAIYKEGKVLSFVKERLTIDGEYKIAPDGTTDTPFGRFEAKGVSGVTAEEMRNAPANIAYFGLNDGACLTVRARHQGDKVYTFGGNTKKLKDIFIDKKIPVFLRDFIPVVCIDGEIAWVPEVIRGKTAPVIREKGIKLEFYGKNTVE